MRYLILITLCLFLVIPSLHAAQTDTISDPVKAEVVHVVDGDTLDVLTTDRNKVMRIRLYGIDAPETHQAYGLKALILALRLALRTTVTVDIHNKDNRGTRYVGDITLPDGTNLSYEMIRQGYAWWYRDYTPYETRLQRAEEEARKAKRGLWRGKNPIAPWEWRKLRRQGKLEEQ